MADLNSKDSSQLISIVGIDSTTGETNPVNANASGELLTALPPGAATSANQTSILNEIDASNYAMNEAFSKAQAIAGQLDDASSTVATEDNIAPIRITPQRALHINIRNQSGTEIGIPAAPLHVDNQNTKASYSAAVLDLSSGLLATDVFTITGSATKTVRVTQLQISATKTTSTNVDFLLLKRSTANTGGTSSTLTAVPLDSTSAAATATARSYTANPTTGTLVGNLRTAKMFINTITGGASTFLEWKFGEGCQPIYLRGTSEVLALNLNGATLAGSSLNIYIEWTEE